MPSAALWSLGCCCQVLETLLKAGANLFQKDADDWMAIHYAALRGWDQGVAALLRTLREKRKARVRAAHQTW